MDGAGQRRIAETIALVRLLVRYADDPATLTAIGRAWSALEALAAGRPAPGRFRISLGVRDESAGHWEGRDLGIRIGDSRIAFHRADRFHDEALGDDQLVEPVSLAEWTDLYDQMAQAPGVRLTVEEEGDGD